MRCATLHSWLENYQKELHVDVQGILGTCECLNINRCNFLDLYTKTQKYECTNPAGYANVAIWHTSFRQNLYYTQVLRSLAPGISILSATMPIMWLDKMTGT